MQKAPDAWDRFGFALTHSGNSMGAVGKQAAEARQALEDYRSGLDPVAEAQSRVTEWTNTLSDRLTDGKVVTEDARTAQERLAYWSDVLAGRQSALKDAVAGATSTSQTFEQQTKDTRDALDAAKNATDNFKLSLDILSGANVSSIELESRFQAALAEADGALQNLSGHVLDDKGNLDLHSEAGRKAADVLLDVRNSGNDLISTMIQQGATSDQVQAKDAELRDSFIKTAGQMGITGQNAQNLADKILGIPADRKTTITADTGRGVDRDRQLGQEDRVGRRHPCGDCQRSGCGARRHADQGAGRLHQRPRLGHLGLDPGSPVQWRVRGEGVGDG
jgi:major membrane immunogen (membrane-anchored lipoprotein)